MTNLQVFNFKDQDVRVVLIDGEPWWVAADVCRILEITNVSQAVASLDEDEKGISFSYTLGGKQKTLYVNKDGLVKLIAKSRKPKAIDVARSLELDIGTLFYASKEQHTISIISAAFSHIRQVSQYYVEGYRIDLYFPDYKVAVECDEQGHKQTVYTKEPSRQQQIELLLNCTFIRYNPDAKDFNVGVVINKIMRAFYG